MLATVNSATLFGLNAIPIIVEVDVARGLPGMTIVGLGDKAVEEAKERVRSALSNSGFQTPAKRITINLAPADVKKEGAGFDLPIAIGILMAEEIVPKDSLKDSWILGELALTGDVRHVPGILPIARQAKKTGIKTLYIPTVDVLEAVVVNGVTVYPVSSLNALVNHCRGEVLIPQAEYSPEDTPLPVYENDFMYVKGQDHAKRALEIAAAGGHNVLFSGPPGSGKTLLARCLPSILPPMNQEEQLEVSQIYSAVGLLNGGVMHERPFRSPHHTTSNIALVGGGSIPRPGEVTLAHLGILFLDELPEFQRSVLEVLRQPIEDGVVTIARAQGTICFPARFTLIAAQNPCPCGFLTDPGKECICTPHQLIQYHKKISGPILDRIDLHIEVPRLSSDILTDEVVAEPSEDIRKRVVAARKISQKRLKGKALNNASLSARQIKTMVILSDDVKKILKEAITHLHLSARAFHRVIKVALTIADLAGDSELKTIHIAEALQYRPQKDPISN